MFWFFFNLRPPYIILFYFLYLGVFGCFMVIFYFLFFENYVLIIFNSIYSLFLQFFHLRSTSVKFWILNIDPRNTPQWTALSSDHPQQVTLMFYSDLENLGCFSTWSWIIMGGPLTNDCILEFKLSKQLSHWAVSIDPLKYKWKSDKLRKMWKNLC